MVVTVTGGWHSDSRHRSQPLPLIGSDSTKRSRVELAALTMDSASSDMYASSHERPISLRRRQSSDHWLSRRRSQLS